MPDFPTPRTKDMCGGTNAFRSIKALVRRGFISDEDGKAMIGGSNLNPDWEEWLMAFPIGWTDVGREGTLPWLDCANDPANLEQGARDFISRTKPNDKMRKMRSEMIGNAQFPLTAAVVAAFGFALLSKIP